MSHFTVMVIGNVNNLEKVMAPFEESPQDIENSPFCVFKNKSTDPESIKAYQEDTTSLVEINGKIYSRYDEFVKRFEQDEKPGDIFSQKILKLPEGAKEFEGALTLIYPTYESYLSEYCRYNYDEDEDAYGYYHNPNAKWDWYEIGGRWTGFFKGKDSIVGGVGSPGLMTETAKAGYYDQIRLKDIDFEGMEKEAEQEANDTYDKIEAILKGREYPSWEKIRDSHEDINLAREEYHNHPVVKDFHEARFHIWGNFHETYKNSREEYVASKKRSIIMPYAFLKDGQWVERGEMGWFGMSMNEKDEGDWDKEFHEMIKSLPEETLLTLIDCHI